MGHPLKAARPPGERRWKLWHFAALVLVAALAFGAIRAVARDLVGLTNTAQAALVQASIVLVFWLVLIAVWVGDKRASSRKRRSRAGWPLARLRLWGVRRGGVVGFLAWVGGVGLEVIVAVTVVLFATIVLPALLVVR